MLAKKNKTSLFYWFAALSTGVMVFSSSAQAGLPDARAECVDELLENNRRSTFQDALWCAATWACAENHGTIRGVRFASCVERIGRGIDEDAWWQEALEERVQNAGRTLEDFWQSVGVRPQAVARCAEAFLRVLQSEFLPHPEAARQEMENACLGEGLAPELLAEVQAHYDD